MAMDTKTSPLVILAFDGGDRELIESWAREGYLPTLASIMKQGHWGRITSPEQICEHGLWLSLFSGISRSQHGYYDFRPLKPGSYDLQVITPRHLGVLPFWSHLRGGEKKVAIIDAPESGLVPGLSGVQLANWADHQLTQAKLPASAEPTGLLQDVRRVFGPKMRIPDIHSHGGFQKDLQFYHRLLQRVQKKGALCRYLLSQDRFDLVVIGFVEGHKAGHQFWDYHLAHDARRPVEGNELTHAIRDVYQAIDRQMGLLLEQLPRAANLFIISVFGMETQYPTTGLLMEAFMRQLNYQAPPEPAPISLRPLALARKIVPGAWRVSLSYYLPVKVQERFLADHFRHGTNWRKTTAFAIPSLYTGYLRLNLRGREPQGIVEPGAGYEALLDQLEADLQQLVDPLTGEPAVRQVARTRALFGCGPETPLPDLFVKWNPCSHFRERLVHPRAELKQRKPYYFRSSYHSSNGFVAAAGPSIRGRGALGAISLLDLAPTFLSLMGELVSQKLPGKVVRAITG